MAVLLFVGVNGLTSERWAYVYAACNILLGLLSCISCIARFGKPQFDSSTIRETWRVGLYFALGMSSRVAYVDTDKAILASSGFGSIAGSYAAATRIVTMAFTPIQAVVIQPILGCFDWVKMGIVLCGRNFSADFSL